MVIANCVVELLFLLNFYFIFHSFNISKLHLEFFCKCILFSVVK